MTRYEEEFASLRSQARSEDSQASIASHSSDRTKRATVAVHRDKRKRIESVLDKLSRELKDQTASRSFTIKRLAREKQHWFAHSK